MESLKDALNNFEKQLEEINDKFFYLKIDIENLIDKNELNNSMLSDVSNLTNIEEKEEEYKKINTTLEEIKKDYYVQLQKLNEQLKTKDEENEKKIKELEKKYKKHSIEINSDFWNYIKAIRRGEYTDVNELSVKRTRTDNNIPPPPPTSDGKKKNKKRSKKRSGKNKINTRR